MITVKSNLITRCLKYFHLILKLIAKGFNAHQVPFVIIKKGGGGLEQIKVK